MFNRDTIYFSQNARIQNEPSFNTITTNQSATDNVFMMAFKERYNEGDCTTFQQSPAAYIQSYDNLHSNNTSTFNPIYL